METLIYIFLLTVGASFIQRTTGFGFGIFIMTLLPFLMSSHAEATALSGLLALSTSAVITWRYRKHIQWKTLISILLSFAVISAIAIFTLTKIDDHLLRKLLCVSLLILGLYFAFFSRRIKFKTTVPYQIGAGTISGLMGGFFGMHGPPAVLYFIAALKDKDEYMATAQAYFLITNVYMTLLRSANGFLTREVATYFIPCLIAVCIGTFLGALVFKRISTKVFPYVVYAYICISGIIIFLT